MKTLFLFTSLLLLHLSGFAQRERWPVKTLADGFKPDTIHIKKVTVKQIQKKKLVKVGDQTARLKTEKQVVTITGTIKVIKQEKSAGGDGDYHIEVTDKSMDSTFVCECVNPDSAKNSPYINNFINARSVVKDLKVGDNVTFTGVLFQDQKHGTPSKQRTRNYIEMHPILKAKRE